MVESLDNIYYFCVLQLYLNECLNYPISTRCTELARFIDCGSIKDLHDFYPTLVKSIFGTPGIPQAQSIHSFVQHDKQTVF